MYKLFLASQPVDYLLGDAAEAIIGKIPEDTDSVVVDLVNTRLTRTSLDEAAFS